MTKPTFLAEIRASHEPLEAAIGALADDAWTEPLADMDGWTRKDALAHVGWWTDHSARVVTALIAGEVPYAQDPDFDIDAQNRSILEEFRDRDAAEVRAYEAASLRAARCGARGGIGRGPVHGRPVPLARGGDPGGRRRVGFRRSTTRSTSRT